MKGRIVNITALLFLIILIPMFGKGQMNNYEDDFRPFHFGVTVGFNSSRFKITHSESFVRNDSILAVEPNAKPGLNIGIVSNLMLNQNMDLRFLPSLAFAERGLKYELIGDSTVNKTVESTYIQFPFLVKLKSDRAYGNLRVYVLGGFQYSLDMASNAQAQKDQTIIKVSQSNISVDYGLGLDIYFPLFKFSPEIRISHGVPNIHVPTKGLIYSDVLKRLSTKTFLISLYFEG